VLTQVSLGWVYLFMGVLIGSAVIPITLSLFWRRLTGPAMTMGATVGAALGIISWLIVSSLQPGGLSHFFISTGTHDEPRRRQLSASIMCLDTEIQKLTDRQRD